VDITIVCDSFVRKIMSSGLFGNAGFESAFNSITAEIIGTVVVTAIQ
jgi:hypothetical protein